MILNKSCEPQSQLLWGEDGSFLAALPGQVTPATVHGLQPTLMGVYWEHQGVGGCPMEEGERRSKGLYCIGPFS